MNLWTLWGKTMGPKEAPVIHPLLCHMVDVAEVVGAMWDGCLGAGLRRQVCTALGCGQDEARRTLMFWAALHDLGKASPSFQRRYAPAIPILEREGLSFECRIGGEANAWHGYVSAWALPALLEAFQTPPPLARDLAKGLGGHHGSWPPPNYDDQLNTDHLGGPAWDAARAQIVAELAGHYPPVSLTERLVVRPERQALVTLVSGLVSVADWLGSMQEHFGAAPEACDLAAYADLVACQARKALSGEHWDAWRPPDSPTSFGALFPATPAPRPMQQTIIELAPQLDGPALVLIEAPTGSGKTEAALYLADYWAQALQQRGLYVAMPTTATSNAMHTRVRAMLAARYGEGAVAPLLVHSQAQWIGEPRQISQTTESEAEDAPNRVDAMSWFLPRKRSLLAPFGVGTVDQALLSVLLTRHFFVRLFGLAHKTILFDEVHAYDTYMSTLLARLLGWLRAQGSSVVMLSATLPATTRRALLAAYGAPPDVGADAAYPAVTWACGGRSGCQALPQPADHTLALEWLSHGTDALITALRAGLREGGCAAVLCNTVARSQEVYRALREAAIVPEKDLTLFHARFPMAWRKQIEDRVDERYGKKSLPEQRCGIVVATQVIEQSLDLDFDLMVSDLAPIDLLLQRVGRLHRHADRPRTANLSHPRLLLVEPENVGDLPDFGNDAYVYEKHFLLRTLLALQGRDTLCLPSQTRDLIEAVYGEAEQPVEGELAQALAKAKERWEEGRHQEEYEAQTRLVSPASSFKLFGLASLDLEEENPAVHASRRALTRWGSEGITVVCLYMCGDGVALEPDGAMSINLDRRPDAKLTRELVRRSVQITHRGIVARLAAQRPPLGWRNHSLLRHYRPLLFAGQACALTGTPYTLSLSRELGLTVEKKEETS